MKNGSEWKTFGAVFLFPCCQIPHTETAFTALALFSQSGAVLSNGKTFSGYSICLRSGRNARTSASLASLRGCFGSSAIRVRSFPIPSLCWLLVHPPWIGEVKQYPS